MFNIVASTLANAAATYVLGSVLLVLSVALVVLVLLQPNKEKGLSGTITGSADTYFGKSKGSTKEALLTKLTIIVSALFVAAVIGLLVVLAL